MVGKGNGRDDNRHGSGTGRTSPGRNSPGRPSPRVIFRRRRAAVAAALLVLIVIVVAALAVVSFLRPRTDHSGSAASSSGAGASVSPQATASSTAGPETTAPDATESARATSTVPAGSASPTPTAVAACAVDAVTVTAGTDAVVYTAGQNPVLTLKVTNRSKSPCTVNVGTNQMEFLISSGDDRVFSSKDCQEDGADLFKTIAPGASESANFPWTRVRSSAGCAAVTATPGAGGAYYSLTATLGPWTSPKVSFELQ
ncbi:hypothetical protein IV500_10920 [Paeniglutamicibacter antarcticus]|uniref:DUF4232 domain-containing protein n=1 Tax=Arthrobacter terrae TaxID=2935737 RepID=A0A931CU56_9MICC|nr:DUF4232 domain-containing protein [Arthrobacter terrae]MBG0739898.1 hypothetical protein [Arthrobacter terrae]